MQNEKKNQPDSAHIANPAVPGGGIPQQPTLQGGNKGEKKFVGRKHPGVIFVTRTQLFFYVEGYPTVIIFPYPADVVRDLDVINKSLFSERIIDLLTKNNIPPANFYILLGNATLFARQVISADPMQKKSEEEAFLNTVPFENPSTQHIVMGQSTYIVAANKQLYEAVCETLEPSGFEVSLILPEFLFTKEVNLSHGLTAETGAHLIKSMQNFRQFNFLKKETPYTGIDPNANNNKMQLQVKGGKSNRMFVLLGIFFMLIGVLVAVILWTQQQNDSTPKPQPANPPPAIERIPTEIIDEAVLPPGEASDGALLATPSAEVQGDTASDITIFYSQQNAPVVSSLMSRFRVLGFSSIRPALASSEPSTTGVAFSPGVSPTIRETIIRELTRLYGTVSVKEEAIADDIVITLKSSYGND